MSDSFQCANISDMMQIRSLFYITDNEKLLYLSIGSVDLLISTFNIAALVTLSPLKEPPSDILLILTIYSIIKILLIFVAVIYDSYHPPSSSPDNFYSFCLATGFIEIAIRIGKGIYTITLTFIYASKVKNPLKAWITSKREIHFLCIFLIILVSTILFFTNSIGMTIFGYCGVAYSILSVYFIGAVDILYLVAFIGVTFIFLRNLRSVCNNNRTMKYFFNYYLFFLVVISASQLILTVSEFIVAQSCRYGTNQHLFSVSKILVNTSSCSLSVFVMATILMNPQFRVALSVKLAGGFYKKYKKWMERQRQDRQINQTFYEQLLTTNRKTLVVQLQNLELDQGYLANLKDKSRACFLSSVLGCFALQHLQLKGYQISNGRFRTSAVQDDLNSLFSWNFFQKYTFILTNQIVQHYSHIFIKKLPPVSIKFTSYSPNVLYSFNNKLNISQSLSPSNNEKAIAKDCGGGDGGNSGQFFFFNFDRTFILKTISSKQRVVFLQRLQDFHKHFKANPQSLIAKIYSIASVVNIDNQDQVNFSLISNIIAGIDKKYIVRSYDMKGSLHKREVLQKGQKVDEREQIKRTLKDVDFEKLQEKIWISSEGSDKLRNIIKIDSEFLCSRGLIDYSLLVIKLDAQGIATSPSDSKILKEISHYPSEREEGMVYVVGIIDYLQTWNLRKKGEKWYKSLFTQKDKISSQNPSFYSSRFISFSQKILNTN